MNFSFGKKKEAPKVKARPNEGKESFVERVTRQAEEGDVNSQLTLGYMYLYGENGVSKDYEKAFRYYSMAAAQNDSIAVNNVGSLYYSGIGLVTFEFTGASDIVTIGRIISEYIL